MPRKLENDQIKASKAIFLFLGHLSHGEAKSLFEQLFFSYFGLDAPGWHLVAPYCAIPRDYLSDTPLLRAMGFFCLNMANFVRYPPPPFLSVSPLGLGEHAKWRCDTPPSKGVSQ